MKKILFIGGALLLILLVAGIAVALVARTHKPTQTQPGTGTQFPITGNATSTTGGGMGTLTLPANGGTVTVKDFIHNGETVADVENEGTYVLAGDLGYCLADGTCPHGATSKQFSISYEEPSHSFNVVLLQEPLGESRRAAEAFLLTRLGITQKELCALNSYIGVPASVSDGFDGNLGFSFCANSVKLP